METSASIKELTSALVKVQGELKAAKKTSENPFYHHRYADLATVWELCRKPLSDNGLAIIQTTDEVGDKLILETLLCHTSGEWIKGKLPITPVKQDPQGIGSAITYARRYALCSIVGITSEDEDDDAESAMGREQEMKIPEPITQAQQKKIFASSREKGIEEEVKVYMSKTFGKAHTKELNKGEGSQLIEAIEKDAIKPAVKTIPQAPQDALQPKSRASIKETSPVVLKEVKDVQKAQGTIEIKTDGKERITPEKVMADLLFLKDNNIKTIDWMLKELKGLGFEGSKVGEIVKSMPQAQLEEFHSIIQEAKK